MVTFEIKYRVVNKLTGESYLSRITFVSLCGKPVEPVDPSCASEQEKEHTYLPDEYGWEPYLERCK